MTRLLVVSALVSTVALAEDVAPAAFKAAVDSGEGLVLDVRTPGEVAKGKIPGASVIDFNGDKFEARVALIAKDKPVYVYCASGGRSGRAMELMEKKLGFKKVVNLAGGIRAWTAAGYPLDTAVPGAAAGAAETTPEAFDALLKKDKRVLVDFGTQWCTPCQKMKPLVEELAASRKDVKVVLVDVDASEALSRREKVEGLPVFVLYVDGKEKARLRGEQTKEALSALLK